MKVEISRCHLTNLEKINPRCQNSFGRYLFSLACVFLHQHTSQVVSQQVSWSMEKKNRKPWRSSTQTHRNKSPEHRCNTVLLKIPDQETSQDLPPLEGTHFPQAPDVLAAIDAMVSSAMIGAAANQASKQTKAMVKFPPLDTKYQRIQHQLAIGLMNLFFFNMHFLGYFGEASSCVMANIFF